jgi:hypothetical protein
VASAQRAALTLAYRLKIDLRVPTEGLPCALMRRAGLYCVRSASKKKGYRTVNTSRKTAVKIPHVKKTPASKVECEISDQVKTEHIGASYFLESRDFARGVEDVRAGRPPRFDDYAWDQSDTPATDRQWAYEKGRQFGIIAPKSMALRNKDKINLDALRLLVTAINRGDITP